MPELTKMEEHLWGNVCEFMEVSISLFEDILAENEELRNRNAEARTKLEKLENLSKKIIENSRAWGD